MKHEAGYFPDIETKSPNVGEWLKSNLQNIEAQMEKMRLSAISESLMRRILSPDNFSYEYRILSEMPICPFLDRIKPPYGYQISSCFVTIDNSVSPIYHVVFRNAAKNSVCDLTAGQFIEAEEVVGWRPGDRISLLQHHAPDLMLTLSSQIAALCGSEEEIRQKFGLRYYWRNSNFPGIAVRSNPQ